MKKFALTVSAIIFGICSTYAQEDEILVINDTTDFGEEDAELFEEVSDLDPQRAALLSAILPGLGQAYNRQYWKVPIVISGFVVFGHFISYNNTLYHAFRNAVILETDGDDSTVNPYAGVVSTLEGLTRNRDNFRRNRDFMMILGTLFYALQIVDAHVSAHLNEFNVNDDLSLHIEPSIQSTPLFSQAVGASLVIRF
jgi:hypothetical protein